MATGEIGYADRRLGGASVWFIHNPNAISISYTYLVNVQQLVFHGKGQWSSGLPLIHGTPRPSSRRSMQSALPCAFRLKVAHEVRLQVVGPGQGLEEVVPFARL